MLSKFIKKSVQKWLIFPNKAKFQRSLINYLALFFIGIANALPLPIMGSVLSIWLSEFGFEKSQIGLFALLGIPFSLKILWTPFVDQFALPFFSQTPRKGWLFFSLSGMALCILGLSFIDPSKQIYSLAGLIAALSSFTGCLYITGIAYELESLQEEQYPTGSANVVAGYRIGLLVAGAGSLLISSLFGWQQAFCCLALLLFIGSLLILFLPEPFKSKEILEEKKQKMQIYPSSIAWFWKEVLWQPCSVFFQKYNWPYVLLIVLLFKLGDELCMVGPFYLSIGFQKIEIATAAKTWGMIMTLLGAFAGGTLLYSKSSANTLIKIGCLHASTLYCYYFMTFIEKSLLALYLTVAFEHFTTGLLMTTFIAFLWKQCDKHYAPIQYCLFWSLISLKNDMLCCLGGFLASYLDWRLYFFTVATIGTLAAITPAFFTKYAFPCDALSHSRKLKGS